MCTAKMLQKSVYATRNKVKEENGGRCRGSGKKLKANVKLNKTNARSGNAAS